MTTNQTTTVDPYILEFLKVAARAGIIAAHLPDEKKFQVSREAIVKSPFFSALSKRIDDLRHYLGYEVVYSEDESPMAASGH